MWGWIRRVGTRIGFDTLGFGHSRTLVMAMRTRRVLLGLSSRGAGYPAVGWLSRLWRDLLVSGSGNERLRKGVGIPHGPPSSWLHRWPTLHPRFHTYRGLSLSPLHVAGGSRSSLSCRLSPSLSIIVAGGVVVVVRVVVIDEHGC